MKAIDVANLFVDISVRSEDNDLTNMKLNKLVYFAQAQHLASYKTPLFDDEIQAWKHGPVIPSVYAEFKKYGDGIITGTTSDTYNKNISSEDASFLADIILSYGKFSASELRRKSHEKGGPWDSVYREGVSGIVISNKLMEETFSDPDFKPFKIDRSRIPKVGYRDKDGYLVLPAEMNCPEDDIYDELYGEKSC